MKGPISPFRRSCGRSHGRRSPRRTSTTCPPPAWSGAGPCSGTVPESPGGIRSSGTTAHRATGAAPKNRRPGAPPRVGQVVRLLDFPEARGLLEEDRFVERVVGVSHRARIALRDVAPGVLQPLLVDRVGAEDTPPD